MASPTKCKGDSNTSRIRTVVGLEYQKFLSTLPHPHVEILFMKKESEKPAYEGKKFGSLISMTEVMSYFIPSPNPKLKADKNPNCRT